MAYSLFDDVITFIYARDLDATIDFYENKLELECVYDYGGCRIYRASEHGFLGICNRENAPIQPDEYKDRHIVFTFVTDDVDGWFERLAAKGVYPTDKVGASEEYGVYSGFIKDPNGYFLEIQKFLNPDWAPGGKSAGS
jgi:catechol 2,3-dioxygenase-like lactoylglutathione lyase family enzyme